MTRALLSIGSNQSPEKNLLSAAKMLRDEFEAVTFSHVYRTAAVGFKGADFLNCAAIIDYPASPEDLNRWLHQIEDLHGRRRDVPRFSDRPLDMDIVLFGDQIVSGPKNLQVPRQELHLPFVARPCSELAPNWIIPGRGLTLLENWRRSLTSSASEMELVELIL